MECLFPCPGQPTASPPELAWIKAYGGEPLDQAVLIQPTADGYDVIGWKIGLARANGDACWLTLGEDGEQRAFVVYVVDISDAIFTLAFLFTGSGRPFPPPNPSPGADPTEDQLDCVQYPSR